METIERLKINIKALMQEGQTEEAKERQYRILTTICLLMRGLGNMMKPAGLIMLCTISFALWVSVAAGQTVIIPALGPLLMLMLFYPFGFLFEMVGEIGLILLERRDFEEITLVSNGWAGGRNYR